MAVHNVPPTSGSAPREIEGEGCITLCSCSRCYYTPILRSPVLPFPAPICKRGLVQGTHQGRNEPEETPHEGDSSEQAKD